MKSTALRAGASIGFALLFVAAYVAAPVLSAQAGQPGAWQVLFDGKNIDTFNIAAGGRRGQPPPPADAPAGWHIENGVLIGGEQKPGERSGALQTKEKYYDFELQLDFLLGELPNVKCSEELGAEEQNLSDSGCLGNSGISYRSGYQLNIGRREGGEYVGLVIHRVDPKAIRKNILWLSHGDRAFPNLRKKGDWNSLRIAVKGDHHEAWLNGTKIVDVMDKSTLESEAAWRQPQSISIQMPYTAGVTIKYRNIRVRTL
jgi:hypothetical protein